MYKNMFLYGKTRRYLKNDYQFSDSLKTKDRKIRGDCNLLIKVKFHGLEWTSPLNLFLISSNLFPVCYDWILIECQLYRFRCKSVTEFLRGYFSMYFLLCLRKKTPGKKLAKNFPSNSVKNIRPYSFSRENAVFATLITPSEKTIDSYKLIS